MLGVDESLNVDLLVSATQLGLQGGTLTIASDDPLFGTLTQNVLATGIPEAGPMAQIGDDFVAIEMPTFNATPILRDRTNLNGDYEFFLTSESLFEVTLFDPDTGLIAKSLGRTSPTGNITFITQPAFIASVSPDSDGDILPDDAEFAIGTAINNPDTDGDGVTDYGEIEQGLNPLSGLTVSIGPVGSLALFGEANEVEVVGSVDDLSQQFAYLATGSHGLAIVDASDSLNPIAMGQLDLGGESTDVAISGSLKFGSGRGGRYRVAPG